MVRSIQLALHSRKRRSWLVPKFQESIAAPPIRIEVLDIATLAIIGDAAIPLVVVVRTEQALIANEAFEFDDSEERAEVRCAQFWRGAIGDLVVEFLESGL